MKILCLVWGPFGHRMDELAEAVGAERVDITVLYGPRYFAPLRYLVLFVRTLLLLYRQRPDAIYAQNPPVFCPLSCLLYSRIAGSRLIIDHHSIWSVKTLGNNPVSTLVGMLERFVARSADANTAPHGVWARKLEQMRARGVTVIHDFVTRNPYSRDEGIRRKFAETKIIAIASHGGHPLERIEAESQAAGSVSAVTLLICGPEEKLRARLSAGLPKNVKYIGFLRREDYLRLKASVDFALNISDEPYTLSHVLFEYAASSLPIISSRQEVVEEIFGDSILYANSADVEDTAEKVRLLAGNSPTLAEHRRRITEKYEKLADVREDEKRKLREILQSYKKLD